jgi:antitoxin component of MazEF toxin-antitoxin module
MKRAKQRPLPSLAKLISSSKQASRSIAGALVSVNASNKRIAKKEKRAAVKALGRFMNNAPTLPRKKYWLADLMAQIPPRTKFEEIDFGPPVGKEIL